MLSIKYCQGPIYRVLYTFSKNIAGLRIYIAYTWNVFYIKIMKFLLSLENIAVFIKRKYILLLKYGNQSRKDFSNIYQPPAQIWYLCTFILKSILSFIGITFCLIMNIMYSSIYLNIQHPGRPLKFICYN